MKDNPRRQLTDSRLCTQTKSLSETSTMSSSSSVSVPGSEKNMTVIREIYNGVDAQELFENELERALEVGCDLIVIEPERLAEDTVRWIALGDCLHSTVLATGSGSVVSSILWEEKPYIYCPLTGLGLFCAAFYNFSWKQDPCSMYRTASQTERDDCTRNVTPQSHTVLIRRREGHTGHRSLIQSAVALISITFSAWKLFKWIKFVVA